MGKLTNPQQRDFALHQFEFLIGPQQSFLSFSSKTITLVFQILDLATVIASVRCRILGAIVVVRKKWKKQENRILRSFLLISYHIRTGLALTALCKSYSQTLEQLTKIYTQPFIPSLLLSSNTPAACFCPVSIFPFLFLQTYSVSFSIQYIMLLTFFMSVFQFQI